MIILTLCITSFLIVFYKESTKLLLFRRPIGYSSETHRKPIYLFGDQNTSLETHRRYVFSLVFDSECRSPMGLQWCMTVSDGLRSELSVSNGSPVIKNFLYNCFPRWLFPKKTRLYYFCWHFLCLKKQSLLFLQQYKYIYVRLLGELYWH